MVADKAGIPLQIFYTLKGGSMERDSVNYGPCFNNSPKWSWGVEQKLDFGLSYGPVMSAWNKDFLFSSIVPDCNNKDVVVADIYS